MGIYCGSLIIIVICGILFKKKIQIIACASILFLISAFRSVEVGGDLINYIPFFHKTAYMGIKEILNSNYELGYIIFNKIINFIYNNDQFFIFMSSLVVIFFIAKYISRYSLLPWLSYYLFVSLMFFGSSFNLVRQSMAMAIVLNSIKYIEERNLKKFILNIFIASLFHRTAMIFIILYFTSKYKINIKYFFVMILSAIGIILFGDKIISILMNSSERYLDYTDKISSGNGYGMLAMLIIVLLFGLIFGKNSDEDKFKLKIHYHMIILAILMQLLALKFSLFSRVTSYFSIGLIVFISNIIKSRPEIYIRYLGEIAVCILTVIFFVYSSQLDLNGILPYIFGLN